MSGAGALQEIMDSRRQLASEQRHVEADAFAVLRTRPIYFALKLLFGIGHNVPPEADEPEPTDETEPVTA